MGTETTYKFNYHDEYRSSWEQWIVIHLMTQSREAGGEDEFEEIRELTNGGRDCQLQIFLNGKEFDAKALFDRIFKNMEWEAQKEASRIVSQIPGFTELEEMISEAQHELKWRLKRNLQAMGIEIYEED